VKWTDDGWPQILPPGERVPYVVPEPKVGRVTPNAPFAVPLTGNFTWRDEFAGTTLSPLWIMLRQPHETWWHRASGQLTLTPRSDTLSGKGQPSFLGRRLQHARFEASTALEVPTSVGVSAGLVAFQSETHHYYFAVRRTADGVQLFLERLNGKEPELVASAKLTNVKQLKLRLTGEDNVLSFSYAADSGDWQTLVADADATAITTQAAGGFVGALVGLHARIEGR
jgi:xylan 1,4-beta-xylosidase